MTTYRTQTSFSNHGASGRLRLQGLNLGVMEKNVDGFPAEYRYCPETKMEIQRMLWQLGALKAFSTEVDKQKRLHKALGRTKWKTKVRLAGEMVKTIKNADN